MKELLSLLPFLKPYRGTFVRGLLAIVCSTVLGVAIPVVIRHAIDDLQGAVSGQGLIRYALTLVALAAGSGLFLYYTRQTIIVVSRRVENDLRNVFLERIAALPLRFFQHTPTGDIIAHTTNDIGAVRMLVGPAVMYSTETLFTFIIVVVIMIGMDPMLTLISLAPLPFISFAVYGLGKSIHHRYTEIQAQFSVLTTRAQENVSGMRIVKAYRREEYETGQFEDLSRSYLRKNLGLVKVQSIMMPLLSVIIGLAIVGVVWFGGEAVVSRTLTIGELTQFIIYLGFLIWPMIAVGWVVSIVQRAAASMKRLSVMMATPVDIRDEERTNHAITAIAGEIRFEEVSFRYGPALPLVLDAVHLHVPTGSTLAIIGYTGSGKSTLVHLLPRLFDVTGGRITVDGWDVRDIPLAVLRRGIAFVTQETFLFSDTIAANIAYGVEGARRDQIEAAAAIAQLDTELSEFPDGYDTILGERGITLSGGQKQRVSIARAILRNPAILILDDALSAVDTHTEERILMGLKDVMASRTSIIISHRISTVKHADAIIVLRDGHIHEQGKHEDLLALGGIYADLYTKQLLAEELEELE